MVSVKSFFNPLSFEKSDAIACDCCPDPAQAPQPTRTLWFALGLLSSFLVVEWLMGSWVHSLSLQADAGHLFSDVAALGVTLLIRYLCQRPATSQATFGYRRLESLAALANGVGLLAIALFIFQETLQHWLYPEPIRGLPMVFVAILGLAVNGVNIALLHPHSHQDLNIRGAWLHMVSDAASSLGLLLGSLAIYTFHWTWVDPALSSLVVALTAASAIPLIKTSLEILMESVPATISVSEVESSLQSFEGVIRIDAFHLWSVATNQHYLCAHLRVDQLNASERDRLVSQLQTHLQQKFGIQTAFLQITDLSASAPTLLHPLFQGDLLSQLSRSKP